MEALVENISKQCSAYEDLQDRHLTLLKAQNLPDLSEMTRERRSASTKLKTAINEFIDTAGASDKPGNITSLNQLKKRLGLILRVDETIGGEIQKHKSLLEKSMNQLKHGKKALQGYRPTGSLSQSNRPRVLSISR